MLGLSSLVASPAPTDPQRLCSRCRTETFFVTLSEGLLSLICTQCRQAVLLALFSDSIQVVAGQTRKKGD